MFHYCIYLRGKKRTYTYIDNKVKISMISKVTVLLFWVSKMKKKQFLEIIYARFDLFKTVIINTPDCRYIFTGYLIYIVHQEIITMLIKHYDGKRRINKFKRFWKTGAKNGERNHANKTRLVVSH